MANFVEGSSDPINDPNYKADKGAGIWKSKKFDLNLFLIKKAMSNLSHVASGQIGNDAANHLRHYLNNSGKDYQINMKSLLKVRYFANLIETELSLLQEYVNSLKLGIHHFTSRSVELNNIHPGESKNWYFAMAGFLFWSKGHAIVREENGKKAIFLEYEIKVRDRYNWDGMKSIHYTLTNYYDMVKNLASTFGLDESKGVKFLPKHQLNNIIVKDTLLGELHLHGFAKEYNLVGSHYATLQWGDLTWIKADWPQKLKYENNMKKIIRNFNYILLTFIFLTSMACADTVTTPVQTDGVWYEKDVPKDLMKELSNKSSLKMPEGAKILHCSYSSRDYSSIKCIIFSAVPFSKPNNTFDSFSIEKEKIIIGLINDSLPKLMLGDAVGGATLKPIKNKYGRWNADWIDTTTGYYLYLTGIK